MSNEERSLAEEAPEPSDVSEPTERGPLSVEEFLAGVRAQRRVAWIRPRADLYAEMQRLVDEIEASPEGSDVDHLIDAYEDAKGEFARVERWVVEQRTPERRRHVRREAAKALGIEMRPDGESPVEDDVDQTRAAELEAHVIADHVVEPMGVSAEQVRALYEASPGEYTKIDRAVVQVMRVLDERAATEVLRDFSSRRSGKTQRSSKH